MNWSQLRRIYPKFIFEKYSTSISGHSLQLQFEYSIPPDHQFTHTVTYKNCGLKIASLENFVFHIGLAEMFSYWKTTCSPHIEIAAGRLNPDQTQFWHRLLIKGMGQYFFQNQIDFSPRDFITITSSGQKLQNSKIPKLQNSTGRSVLVPLGGGQDSIVTAELLKGHFDISPVIVYPATPASAKIARILTPRPPISIYRQLDPRLLELTQAGYLTGHVPYSAILAFIFLLAAAEQKVADIAVSNERSADEGNVRYLGQTINHQYSKTQEFESDLVNYVKTYLTPAIHYFSFLRPLYELQIAKLFANFPQYFPLFKSCNKNQQQESWCGHCPKCLSIALTLTPWIGQKLITQIMGAGPLTDPANQPLLDQMTNPQQTKPFECIVSTEEAQICLELITQGNTPRVVEFLARWQDNPNLPPQFSQILKHAYAHS